MRQRFTSACAKPDNIQPIWQFQSKLCMIGQDQIDPMTTRQKDLCKHEQHPTYATVRHRARN